jgi:hypothetical protein
MIMKAFEAVLTPHNDLSGVRGLLTSLPEADATAIAAASARNGELTKPWPSGSQVGTARQRRR